MQHGTVRWFNEAKGYGYIAQNNGEDVFVHFSVIEMDGYKSLQAGQQVAFDCVAGEKGLLATRVTLNWTD
jgi:CspA family cold shock protein